MSEANPAPRERCRVRAHSYWAWAIIALVCGGIAARQAVRAGHGPRRGVRRLQRAVAEMQGKYLVGAAELPFADRQQLLEQIDELQTGSPRARLRAMVLVGELAGPKAALRRLTEYDEQLAVSRQELSSDERAVENLLRRLYRDQAAGRVSTASLGRRDRHLLVKKLGWHGRLALCPSEGPDREARETLLASARRTMYTMLAAVATALLAGAVGLAALGTFLILLFSGRLQRPLVEASLHGGVYAETFALWLLLFVGLTALPPALASARWLHLPRHSGLLMQCSAMLLSLAALAWPVWRGVPWAQVRREIGWTLGRRPLAEILLGGATYVAAIPLLALGLIGVFVLLKLEKMLPGAGGPEALDPTSLPSHPIVEWLTRGGTRGRLQIILLASVVAPIVEETMFRGVLYRHLRDATGGKMRFGLSVLLSGAAVSFLFAVIHPQGWVAVPALMSLAFAFTLAREWRGTLLPAIIAHGLNNGLLTWLLIRLVGG